MLWKMHKQVNNFRHGSIISFQECTFRLEAIDILCVQYHFLPAEKNQEDTALPWLPPPKYKNPLLLHTEEVTLSHQYSKNQENKVQKVRCCWSLNNKIWHGQKHVDSWSGGVSFTLSNQLIMWVITLQWRTGSQYEWFYPGGQLIHSSGLRRPVLLLKVPEGQGKGELVARGQ